jgi:type IV secretory pathway VirD2 relaxase
MRRLALKRRLGEGGWHRSSFSNNLNAQRDGARGVHLRGSTFYFDLVRVTAILCGRPIAPLARGASDEDRQFMVQDQGDDFHVRPGRVRSRGTRINPRGNLSTQPFLKQVQVAVRKAGGDPNRIGREPSPGGGRERGLSGRFNARGRGAKVVPLFLREGHDGGWQQDSSGRVRSRRVAVKARIIKLNPQGRRHQLHGAERTKMRGKAVDAHLRYLERDGVNRDGQRGKAYSAVEDDADSKAFAERGREDRHQFRFIVAPEDSNEMADLKSFTRDLMRQVEKDLETRLDWIAIDHYNTGHPHTHIIVRGVLDQGGILNIAGDYIAHGIRYRASELVTLELGHQSELELQAKLETEIEAERWTRLDKMLATEQHERGVIDLRPGEGGTYAFRENRGVMIGRVKFLERYGLSSQVETGQWVISDRAEDTLKELSDRNDIIKTMHRALASHGLEEERGIEQYVRHGVRPGEKITGRILAKGLAGDEMDERVYLVLDGVDGRVHHVEFPDGSHLKDIGPDMIVEVGPAASGPRAADRNIALNSGENDGIYRPSRHLERIRQQFERELKDPESFVRSHVRRLEALRRAGHVERIDEDHWKVPGDILERGQAYDRTRGGDGPRIKILSSEKLERQIATEGATWLDRELTAREPQVIADSGFGRNVRNALQRRTERLVEMGYATVSEGTVRIPSHTVANLEQREVDRVGREMAAERGLTFTSSKTGDYVSGRLTGVASLTSGRFAMLEDGLGFRLVPWQPILETRIGQFMSGVQRDSGGIDWDFGRKRGLGL